MGQDGFSETEMNKAFDDLKLTIERMEAALSDGRSWVLGDRFTLVDICLIPTFDRLEDLRYNNMWEENHPYVTAWFKRVMERPSVQKAFYEGSRFSEVYPDLELGKE